MTKIVIDASTAAKWALSDEPEAEKAREMLLDYESQEVAFVAPRFWQYEIANIFNKAVGRGDLTEVEGQAAFEALQSLEIEFVEFPSPAEAYAMSRKYQRSVYDSFYLAVAEVKKIDLWTGDEKLYNAVKDHLSFVKWIGDYLPLRF